MSLQCDLFFFCLNTFFLGFVFFLEVFASKPALIVEGIPRGSQKSGSDARIF